MFVLDASAAVLLLTDDGVLGQRVEQRVRGEQLCAPELIDLEVTSALRRFVLTGALTPQRGRAALSDLVVLPVRRAPHRTLLERCWELRDSVTVYDAAYVALAEALTTYPADADARLAWAPGLHCDVEVVGPP